jgi:hypothetical protein
LEIGEAGRGVACEGGFPFCFPGWFLRVVRVKTKMQERVAVAAACGDARSSPGGSRGSSGTKVRTRCKGRELAVDVQEEISAALLHIVQASVEKAKAGDLHHAKWLWGVVEEGKKRLSEDAGKEQDTLAMVQARELALEGSSA